MSDQPAITISSSTGALAPEEITNRSFPTVRRGLDPQAVRRALEEVAAHLRELRVREGDLRTRLAEAEQRAAAPQLDDQTLSAAIGTETGRVLQVAHEAAHEIVAKAEARAAALLADAESALAERSRAIEEQSEALLESARADARELLETTRVECQTMVDEAREARRRILADLVDRRRSLHIQLEQLRAGKEALSTVVGAVATSVEAVRDRLLAAEENARVAADAAGRGPAAFGDDRPIEEVIAEALEAARSQTPPPSLPPPVLLAADLALAEPETEPETEPLTEVDKQPAAAEVFVDAAVEDAPVNEAPEPDALVSASAEDETGLDELFARLRADQVDLDESAAAVLEEASEVLAGSAAVAEEIGRELETAGNTAPDASTEEAPTVSAVVLAPGDEVEIDLDRSAYLRRDALFGPSAAELSRVLKRLLRVEQNELLDACRKLSSAEGPSELFELDGAVSRIAQATTVALTEAFQAGASYFGENGRPVARAEIGREADAIARGLGTELSAMLSRRLREGLEASASEDLDAIALVNATFRDWKGSRVESLAGDFATRAFSRGTLARARANEIALSWLVDDGEQACPDCEDNALAGVQPAGEKFPTGHEHSPVHPGCRCILAPAP